MGANMRATLIFVILFSTGLSDGRKIVIECTTNCRCDVYEGLRRATCENGKMLNVKDNVPNETEILEFSYNYVSLLTSEEFYRNGLSSLKLANLSHNRIKDIQIHSFEKMGRLKTLDLSFNALQYVLAEWFWSLGSLEELYLNNNNLGSLRDAPMFESNSLKILNLANCQIPHAYRTSFSEIPSLEQLDISGNHIVELSSDVFEFTSNLTVLKLSGNKMTCDDVGLDLIAYTKENGIFIDENYCKKSEPIIKQGEKSQKMMKQEGEGKNAWIFDIKEDEVASVAEIRCSNNTTGARRGALIEVIEISPEMAVLVLLTVGFLFGLIFGCACEITGCKFKKFQIKRQRTPRRSQFRHRTFSIASRRGLADGFADSLIQNIDNNAESTPMVERRNTLK